MRIRCPQCKRHFNYDPAGGPAQCPYEGCGWSYQGRTSPEKPAVLDVVAEPESFQEFTGAAEEKFDDSGKSLVLQEGRFLSPGYPPSGVPQVNYIRCSNCRMPLPDDTESCPVCGLELGKAFREREGVRAIFDVSGDITFTPKMVAFLFLATLAAFLTFVWILSRKDRIDNFPPLATVEEAKQSGDLNSALQGIPFAEMKKELLDPRNTDVRKDALKEKFIGQRVIWSGLVKKVSAENNHYHVDIVMEGEASRSFVTLNVLKIPTNEKMIVDIERGQTILFSGKINQFDFGGSTDSFDYFRVVLDDGIILK